MKYALVDPPCTGSGIVKRMDNLVDGPERKDEGRLRSLSNLQVKIASYFMHFTNFEYLHCLLVLNCLVKLVSDCLYLHFAPTESCLPMILYFAYCEESFYSRY